MRKNNLFLIIVLILINSISFCSQILHMDEKEEKISTGAVLKQYEILTSDGFIKAQVIELDLEDEYNKLTILSSPEGSKKLASVSAMLKVNKAIAGINGDFFAGNKGIGNSIGLTIDNENIISSSAEDNKKKDTFASFIINDNNKVFYEFLKDDIKIVVEDGEKEFKARYINKYTDDATIPTIYTKEFGKNAIGSSESLVVTEFVIENGKVVEILENESPANIPEDGFVIMIQTSAADELKEYLKLKSKVSYKVSYEPDLGKINLAISGGAKLIENGIIPDTYSHYISGRNPRTIIGTNKNNSTVYLITVDGRSNNSIGMTMEEESAFVKELGLYNAINLDGGGSTTMVSKELGNNDYSIINSPSGGTQRLVANTVAVVSTAPVTDKLYEIKINIEDKNVFVGEKRKIEVVGYDKYYNPVEVNYDDITWDYDGVETFVEDGYVYGNVVGESTIIAKIGKIKAECEINILSKANELYVYPKNIVINPGENINYTVKAKNKNGYYATTDLKDLQIKTYKYYKDGKETTLGNELTIDNTNIKFVDSGTYILSFNKGNCTTYTKVVVKEEDFILIDDFESETFTFDPYPDEVGGNATLSTMQKISGNSSVLLEYDFDKDTKVRGAYIVFNKEQVIPKDATAISFYLYNDDYKYEDIKIKFKDSNDKYNMIVIDDSISHNGWKEIRLDVSNFAKPLYVSDIYLAQNDENVKSKGYVYVDKFGYYTKSNKNLENNIIIPKDIKIEDSDNISVNNQKAFNVAFVNSIDEPSYMMDVLKTKRYAENLNQKSNFVVVMDNNNKSFMNKLFEAESGEKLEYGYMFVDKVKTNHINCEQYDLFYNDNVTIITMDISKNGIRKSDEEQYFNLENDIKDDETGNVIIVLNGTLDDFDDEKERKIFVDMLCEIKRNTNKNIIVVQEGYYQDYQMERGVKFLSIKDNNNDFENKVNSRYLLVSVNGKEMSYEYKKIF